jgi:hypothetical protein
MLRRIMLTDDELAALRWLLGDDNDRRLGIEPGRAALIRLLQNPPLSNADICRALARALTPVAVGEMKFHSRHRRPCAGRAVLAAERRGRRISLEVQG